MTVRYLTPEDLPPKEIGHLDRVLQQQLELATRQYFLETCNKCIQSLLGECEWTIGLAEGLTLEIRCPDTRYNWRVLNHIQTIADRLARLRPQAKIRVYPPSGAGTPFNIRVDEREVYREP